MAGCSRPRGRRRTGSSGTAVTSWWQSRSLRPCGRCRRFPRPAGNSRGTRGAGTRGNQPELRGERKCPDLRRQELAGTRGDRRERRGGTHNPPVVGSIPTRPTHLTWSDALRGGWQDRQVGSGELLGNFRRDHECPRPCGPARRPARMRPGGPRSGCGCTGRARRGWHGRSSRIVMSSRTSASCISETPVCRPPSCSLITGTPASAARRLNRLDTWSGFHGRSVTLCAVRRA
jgi:hypothetical protein